MSDKTVSIAGAAGAWGDSSLSTAQLLTHPTLDYIIYEMLAEVTMAILTRARMKDPSKGYTTDFVDPFMKRHLKEIHGRGIKVVTNAGGIHPQAAAEAVRAIAAEQGLDLKVAVVEGDNLITDVKRLQAADVREMAYDTPLPSGVIAINAYLGAFPIAQALADGADMVITGRVVDSALVLGPLIHEFGWDPADFDKLAQGSLAGHLLECGPQSTGGLMTDWEEVESWVNIGYPIAECKADGSFVVTKPAGTDGLVSTASITEQILYEIGNPRAYMLPDVSCDFADVQLTEVGEHRVEVIGAKGSPPSPTYKACALEMDGYRLSFLLMVTGHDAARKAERVGETLFARMRRVFPTLGWKDFRKTSLEILGSESQFGPHSHAQGSREVILKISAHHDKREALSFFARETPSSALSMAQSLIGGTTGLPRPTPLIRVHSMLIPRDLVSITVDDQPFEEPSRPHADPAAADAQSERYDLGAGQGVFSLGITEGLAMAQMDRVPLRELAYGRSGDKGNICNIGIVARKPEYLQIIRQELTADRVMAYLGHLIAPAGRVERYELPGLNAFNFLLYEALDGGGTSSLRFDPLGKGMAQILLECEIDIPVGM